MHSQSKRSIVSAALVALWACGPLCVVADAPENASVLVRVSGAAGSGVAIAPDVVATNGHVIGWRMDTAATVTAHADGRTYRATVVALDPDADVALLQIHGGRLDPVRLAPTPPEGTEVHLLGWGRRGVLARGAGKILRRTFGHRTPRGQVPVVLCHLASEPGDSGGGIFDTEGRLVAINWGAISTTGQSLSTPSEYVSTLLQGYHETQCGGGACPTGPRQTAGSAYGPPPPKFPVQRPTPPPDTLAPPRPTQEPPAPPALVPVAPVAPAVSGDAIAAAILDRIASDPRFRGPAGPQGPAGPAGPQGPKGEYGPQGRDAPPVDLDALADAVAARLASRAPSPAGPEVHYVLVGDDRTTGWDRVLAAYRTASASYRGIRIEPPPPQYVGQLPALVRYTNSIPEYVARGSYEVEQALGRMARGQAL